MSDSGLPGPNSPAAIASMEEDIDDYKWNGLTLKGPPFGLEKIYDYECGGHHPIHLGDRLGKDGRYRVIHKLGNGGFANIWLCRDLECETPKYIGLKILMADESTDDCRELLANKLKEMGLDREVGGKYICLPLDQFQIDGPNGSHFCFVYPVLGPRVSCVLKEFEDPDKDLRKIGLQAVQGMACLHSHGICHGG
jgi:serine/threonine-protein kinase SRPK3